MPELTPDQALAKLRTLPEDKQRLVLSKLSPESRKGILEKLKSSALPDGVKVIGKNSAGQNIYAPEGPEQPQGSSIGRFASSAVSAVTDAAKGLYHGLVDPAQTPEEIGIEAGGAPTGTGRLGLVLNRMVVQPAIEQGKQATSEFKQSAPTSLHPTQDQLGHRQAAVGHALAASIPGVGPWAAQVGEKVGTQVGTGDYAGTVGTLAGNAALYEAPKVIKPLANIASGAVGSAARAVADTSPRTTGEFVEHTLDRNAKVVERTNDKYTESEKKANEALEKKNDTEREKFDEAERKRVEKEGKDRLDALEKDRANIKNYEEERSRIRKLNEDNFRTLKESQKVNSDLKTASRRLDNKVKAAAIKARNEYNSTWNKWRDMVKNVKANMTPVVDSIKAQEASMNPQQVSMFRDILRESEPDPNELSDAEITRRSLMDNLGYKGKYEDLPPSHRQSIDDQMQRVGYGPITATSGAEVPASRLHGWKSQLERAVRTTEDGTLRYAIGKVLQQVRDLETQVSSTVPGAAKQLAQARKITGPYFDAFLKSPEEAPKAAAQTLREQTPEYQKEKAQQDRVDRIAAYDPSIKSLASYIDHLEDAAKKLKPKDVKDFARDNAMPAEKPQPSKQIPIQPARPFEPETRQPATPPEPKIRKLSPEDIQKVKARNAHKFANTLRSTGVRRAIYAAVGTPTAIAAFFSGHPAEALEVGTAAGVTVLGGTHALANLIDKPEVTAWLSKVTPQDIAQWEKLPPEQRTVLTDDMKQLTDAARKKGITVSPALRAFATGVSASQSRPKDLMDHAKDLQSTFHKSGYAPQGNSAPSASHVYDPASGKINPIQ